MAHAAPAVPKNPNAAAPRHISKEITEADRRHRELTGVWPARPDSMAGTVLGVLFRILEAFEHARATLAHDRTQTALGKGMILAGKVPGVDAALADVRFAIESLRRKIADAETQLEAILGAAGNAKPADLVEALRHHEIRQALGAMDAAGRLAILRDADPETVAALRSAPAVVRGALVAPEVAEQFERHAVEAAVGAWLAERPELQRIDPRETKADALHQIDQLEQVLVHVEARIKPYRAPQGPEV